MIGIAAFLLIFTTSVHSEKRLPSANPFKVDDVDALVMEVKNQTKEKPCVWYAPTPKKFPNSRYAWYFGKLFAKGINIAGIDLGEVRGSSASNLRFIAFYNEMVRRGFSKQPILLGQSRGGLMMLSRATGNPDKLSAFVVIHPVCNLESWPLKDSKAAVLKDYAIQEAELIANIRSYNPIDNHERLLQRKVPGFLVHGDCDDVVPYEENSKRVKYEYEKGVEKSRSLKWPAENMRKRMLFSNVRNY